MGYVKAQGDAFYDDNTDLTLSGVVEKYKTAVIEGTLVRKIEHFDPSQVPGNKKISFNEGQLQHFTMLKRDLPKAIPADWSVSEAKEGTVEVKTSSASEYLVTSNYALAAKAAGQLPTGFNLADHYNSRFHPRGLQMTLLGASDAIHSLGIPWEVVAGKVNPDQVGVYSSSVFGQVTEEGNGGLLQARLRGERTTSKQLALGLNTMPADFINAYVLGSVGHTEAITGACASFLYVLQAAVRDIRSGRRRVAIVGNAEAPVTPECSEGFSNMSALASDENLCKIDGSDTPDWRKASRPFGENCGFTLAEGTQYIILMDDLLAMELGADVHGAVPEVFINADGVKKSISAPGVGNYICFAKAVAAAVSIVGKEGVQKRSFVHAHGSSTPANRVTESEVISRVASTFGIKDWPVTAIKAYVGHSISAASVDQLVAALGTFKHGWIPCIKTISGVAPDVFQEGLNFPLTDLDVSSKSMEVAFINSKGFGGNNATAVVLSAEKANSMLANRYSDGFPEYLEKREKTRAEAAKYAAQADAAELNVIYRFGEALVDEAAVQLSETGILIPGFEHEIQFNLENSLQDMQKTD